MVQNIQCLYLNQQIRTADIFMDFYSVGSSIDLLFLGIEDRENYVQYRSNVSYHLSSCFSRDAYCFSQDESRFSRDESRFSRDESRFSRDASRFARESLKHLVWNILYMYYSQEASVQIKDGATILTCKHQKVRSNVHCEILCVSIDCSIHIERSYAKVGLWQRDIFKQVTNDKNVTETAKS